MERADFGRAATARLCACVRMTVTPEAALGLCRAYPCGNPTICAVSSEPSGQRDTMRYVLRQPFIAEIPIAVRSGIRACRPRLRSAHCARKEEKPWL